MSLQRARALLEIGDFVRRDEVHRAHRRLAAGLDPERDAEALERLDEARTVALRWASGLSWDRDEGENEAGAAGAEVEIGDPIDSSRRTPEPEVHGTAADGGQVQAERLEAEGLEAEGLEAEGLEATPPALAVAPRRDPAEPLRAAVEAARDGRCAEARRRAVEALETDSEADPVAAARIALHCHSWLEEEEGRTVTRALGRRLDTLPELTGETLAALVALPDDFDPATRRALARAAAREEPRELAWFVHRELRKRGPEMARILGEIEAVAPGLHALHRLDRVAGNLAPGALSPGALAPAATTPEVFGEATEGADSEPEVPMWWPPESDQGRSVTDLVLRNPPLLIFLSILALLVVALMVT